MEVNQLFSQTVPTTTFTLECPALKIILTISFRNSLGEETFSSLLLKTVCQPLGSFRLVGERNRYSVCPSWHFVQHDAMSYLYVGQKSWETEDSSTGSALSGKKFYYCNAGNARSDAIPEGLVTRDPPPIPQRPKEDIILGGYHIPGGTSQVEFLVYQTERNESIFEDDEAFKPERWLRNKDTASIEAAEAFASLTFGFGTHMYLSRLIVEWSSLMSLTHGGRECGAVHERGHHSWQTC